MNFDLETLVRNRNFVTKYNEAISILRELNFEQILTSLGTPESINYDGANLMQKAASQQIEAIGWYKCLDVMFNFLEKFEKEINKKEDLDFGSREVLRSLGFSEEQINQSITGE